MRLLAYALTAAVCPTVAAPAAPLFAKLPAARTGVDFVNPVDTEHPLDRLYIGAFACGGIAVGDLDGDGLHDLFLTGGPVPDRLYRNLGGLRFEDITGAAGLALSDPEDDRWSAGATLVDIDADGDLDIYVCRYDCPNQLWVNGGGAKFTERAAEFGLAITDASLSASFCDYDRDGDLDCFLLTRDFERAGGRPAEPPVEFAGGGWRVKEGFDRYYAVRELPGGKYEYINAGREDYLLRNDGGRFEDITAGSGLVGRDRGNSCIWWDYDGDGWQDLYVANDFRDPDRLYRNNRDGTFTDVIKVACPHTTWFSMGCDLGDFDGDGRPDLLVADMAGTSHYKSKTAMGEMGASREFLLTAEPRQYMRNALLMNTGTGILTDAALHAGLANSDWTWAVVAEDFDGDGREDVFFSNGVPRNFNDSDIQRTAADFIGKPEWDYFEDLPPRPERNLAFRNAGGLHFEDATAAWGLEHPGMSYAAVAADLDGDLDPDLVVASLDEPVAIYQNASAEGGTRWAKVTFPGGSAHGATVRPGDGAAEVLRPGAGFLSSGPMELCLAVGAGAGELRVTWPDGATTVHPALKAGEARALAPAEGGPAPPAPAAEPLFRPMPDCSLVRLEHEEPPFDDYARQPLLPYQHSRLGPAMAWADVDSDGRDDLYFGGSAGIAGRLYFHRGSGAMVMKSSRPFDAHAASEDSAALFFDADGDGAPDLFVASGSVEAEPGSRRYRDRLYLNDGSGRFVDASPALPDHRDSSSCIAAGDLDGDGDLDLFVGSRVVPGRYPEPPASRLLRNDSAPGAPKFTDITASVPGLGGAGLVAAALWADLDGDSRPDLALATEWGPVQFWYNTGDNAAPLRARNAGEAELRHGWWSALAAGDLDGDGDLDLLAGNFGTNTPYHPEPDKPELLFYGDVGGAGRPNLIEAKFEGEICFPRRGLSCSSHAIPGLRERVGTFHNFATSTLADLYGDTGLADALRLEAHTLESVVLRNEGAGVFTPHPLPLAAQLAPVNAIALRDFDGDGKLDAVLAQNSFAAQPEVGHLDGGLGVLLLGDGRGGFTASPPTASGVVVTGQASGAASPDLDGDGVADLVFLRNGLTIKAFLR